MSKKGDMLHLARAIGMVSRDIDMECRTLSGVSHPMDIPAAVYRAEKLFEHFLTLLNEATECKFPAAMLRDTSDTAAMFRQAIDRLKAEQR